MKQLILIILVIPLLASCAGTGQYGIVNVPEQDVSFMSPPSNWERLFFTSTSEMPTGEVLPVKIFIASWKNNNSSTIQIMGGDISETKGREAREALIPGESLKYGLHMHVADLGKLYGTADYTITSETSGTMQEGNTFTAIEADIVCTSSGSEDMVKLKTVLYSLESSIYFYTLQFLAIDQFFDKDKIVFQQLLDSISFDGHNSTNLKTGN